jgi:hypothetical protein
MTLVAKNVTQGHVHLELKTTLLDFNTNLPYKKYRLKVKIRLFLKETKIS